MPTVSAAVVSLLAEAGIRRLYTVPGESFLGFLDEVERDRRLRLISTRHESGAGFMAEADARMAGIPAVAMASRSPGAANLAIGVETAHYEGTPMLVILGHVESAVRGRGAFQDIDLSAFYAPITKWAVTADRPEDVRDLVVRGMDIATDGRPGPVAIAVPTDFWDAESPPVTEGGPGRGHLDRAAKAASRSGAASYRPDGAGADGAETVDAAGLAAALAAARHPVAIVGGGAAGVVDDLVAVAEHFGLGVYTAFRRQDGFPEDHPHFLGHLGIATPPELLAALEEADVVVAVGTRLDEVTTQGFRYPRPDQTTYRIGSEVSRAGAAAARSLADTLHAIRRHGGREARGGSVPDWSARHEAAVRFGTPPAELSPGSGVHPVDVVTAVRRHFPDGPVVTNDAGNFAGFVHRYWGFRRGDVQLGPAIGAMGYAVPAAIGAKLACPERQVVAFVGDGGVLMTGQELETAVRHGVPVVVVAFRNGLYGTIAMHQARRFGRTAGVDIGEVDLAGWARGLGATAYAAATVDELDAALRAAHGAAGPVLIDVRTDPDLIAPTSRLSDLAGAAGGEG